MILSIWDYNSPGGQAALYYWLANFVALIHGLLVLGIVLGAGAAISGMLRRHRTAERIYYVALIGVILANGIWGDCPLTAWEKTLRELCRPGSAYRASFIGHYFLFLPALVLTWIGPALMVAALLAAPFWRWIDARKAAPGKLF